jgi:hypothetical protein
MHNEHTVSIFRFLKLFLHDSKCFSPAVYLTALCYLPEKSSLCNEIPNKRKSQHRDRVQSLIHALNEKYSIMDNIQRVNSCVNIP